MSPNRLLLKFALRYPTWIVITIVLGFSGALFNGVSTTLIVPVVLGFLGQEINLAGGPPVLRRVMSVFDGMAGDNRFYLMMACILVAIILKNIAGYANSLASSHLLRQLTNAIRKDGLKLVLEVDLDFYVKTKVGDLINRLSGEVGRTAFAIRTAIQIVATVITILVFVGLLLAISWQLTLISTVLLFVVTIANQYYVKRARQFGQKLSEKSRSYSVALLEVLTGIRLVKASGKEQREYDRLDTLIDESAQADYQSQANSAITGPVNEVAGMIVVLAIVILGRQFLAEQFSQGSSLATTLLTYLVILFRLLPFVGQLNNARAAFANSAPSVEIVADFLRRDNKAFMLNGTLPYAKLQSGIGFEGIGFSYPSHEDVVLKDVKLWLPKGTTLALVGASGAGKSTMADLLPRFYDVTMGRITLDGQDLRDYNLQSLRSSMGIVSQDTFLFNDSVRNNIAYARDNATDAEVIEAAKRANAYEFIIKLPKGFETEIGDRGILLSGGQKQRLAIARALLRNPDILILDEATSALDTVSERLVQEALDELSRDRTTLVIAHRLSTVQKAHQIAVLDKGQVVEVGTHDELLRRENGYYARLYSMQFTDQPQKQVEVVESEVLTRASYETRANLSVMIGSLRLLVDGIVDNEQEQAELTEEAYRSALNLLETLDVIEGSLKQRV